MLILSDDMKKLHPRKISEIEEAVRLSRKMDRGKAYTLGIMDSAHPDFLLNTAGVLLALNCSDERRTVRPDIDQLTRIFRRNRLKVPTRFTAEGGRRVTLDELAAGIALDGRSSVLLSFSIR
jgi:hypothetical protein